MKSVPVIEKESGSDVAKPSGVFIIDVNKKQKQNVPTNSNNTYPLKNTQPAKAVQGTQKTYIGKSKTAIPVFNQ